MAIPFNARYEADLEPREKEQTMSEDYTPSMKEIRADYVACNSSPQETMGDGSLITIWQARGHFDCLLAAHDAELREQIAQEIEDQLPAGGCGN